MKRKWFLGVVLAAVPLVVAYQDLSDYPYLFLTGYSERELVKMSRMSVHELEARIGLSEVPGGFYGKNAERGRAAHAIARKDLIVRSFSNLKGRSRALQRLLCFRVPLSRYSMLAIISTVRYRGRPTECGR